jgi:hypothetical protein
MSGPEPCVAALASTRSGPCSLEEEPGDYTEDRAVGNVVDAICSKVLPSRNQTVALRAPDSSFLIERDHRLTDEGADPAMMPFDPQRGCLAYVMLALGFVAIAEW